MTLPPWHTHTCIYIHIHTHTQCILYLHTRLESLLSGTVGDNTWPRPLQITVLVWDEVARFVVAHHYTSLYMYLFSSTLSCMPLTCMFVSLSVYYMKIMFHSAIFYLYFCSTGFSLAVIFLLAHYISGTIWVLSCFYQISHEYFPFIAVLVSGFKNC